MPRSFFFLLTLALSLALAGSAPDEDRRISASLERAATCSLTGPIPLNLRVSLQAAFDPDSQLMRDDLRAAGLIPIINPGTGQSLNPDLLAITGPSAVVDWVLVQLRSESGEIASQTAALLRADGSVIAPSGLDLDLPTTPAGPYDIIIRHRNALAIAGRTVVEANSVDPQYQELLDRLAASPNMCPTRVTGNPQGVRPEEYGAKGDGITDDTSALASAALAASTSGDYLLLTGGATYLTNQSMIFRPGAAGVIVDSGRATLKHSSGATANFITLVGRQQGYPTNVSDFVVQDIDFDYNQAGKFGILAANSSLLGIYDNRFLNMGDRPGITVRAYIGKGRVTDVCIERNEVNAATANGMSANSIIVDGTDGSSGFDMIAYWKENHVVPDPVSGAERIRIADNSVTGGRYGIGMTGVTEAVVTGNTITGNTRNISGQRRVNNSLIADNELSESISTGMNFNYGFTDNVVINNSAESARATNWGAIQAQVAPSGNLFCGNTMRSTSSTGGWAYGLYASIHADDNRFQENEISGRFKKAGLAFEASWVDDPSPYHVSSGSGWEIRNSSGNQILNNSVGLTTSVPAVLLSAVTQGLIGTNVIGNQTGGHVPLIFELKTNGIVVNGEVRDNS